MAPRFPRVPLGRQLLLWLWLALALLAAAPLRAAPYAALVMDARTGQVIHAVNHTARLHPASLTKMMTLYIAFEAVQNGEISLDTRVLISQRAASEPPSRLGLRAGQRIALRHLIRAAALRSGNDAATAIAEAISGSVPAFAARMNRTAAAMGMTGTNFHNAHGLTQTGHMSTVQDMAILSRHLYFDFPAYYNIFSRRSEDAGITRVNNTNSRFLDSYRGADGIKTGFTNAAGYNLAAMAERNGVRILVVVFGGRSSADRHRRVVELMDRGFRDAPRRVATRPTTPPDYSRAAPTTAVAAGRTIRLQTAPQRSPFPRARPSLEVPAPLVASIQSDIASVLEQVVAAPMAAEPQPAAPAPATAAAPESSPVPVSRPDTGAADVLLAARAAGFGTLDLVDIEGLPQADPDTAAGPADETVQPGPAQSVVSAPTPAPPDLPPLQQFLHAPDDIGDPVIRNGHLEIPGLPPLALSVAAPSDAGGDTAPRLASAPAIEGDMVAAISEPLRVDATGQILWRDEELLTTLVEAPDGLDPGGVTMTASDSPGSDAAPPRPEVGVQEIVTRASVLGDPAAGPGWAVSLGRMGSRSEAERILLRVALSEGPLLGAGQRQVVQRSGGFVAVIAGLSGEQAELACLRLSARAQACDVVAP